VSLNEEVVVETVADTYNDREDEPYRKNSFDGGAHGHSGSHIIHIRKVGKTVYVGKPFKIGNMMWQESKESDTEFEYEIDVIKHHATCDELPYGVECALDAYLCHDGWSELGLWDSEWTTPFSESPEGYWKVWVCWERSWVDNYHHYGWDYDQYLDYTRITEEEAQNYASRQV
jgi:hypothetical protein